MQTDNNIKKMENNSGGEKFKFTSLNYTFTPFCVSLFASENNNNKKQREKRKSFPIKLWNSFFFVLLIKSLTIVSGIYESLIIQVIRLYVN